MDRMERIEIDGACLEVMAIAAPAHAPAGLAPLVFLHEGLGSISMWRDWPARLCAATGRSGWLYSRRGYGRSSPIANVRGSGRLPPDYLRREALGVLPQVLEHLGLPKPVLIGHSDGATIALIHAAHHPLAASVVLAPHLWVEDITITGVRRARRAFLDGRLRQALAHHHDDVDSAFWQWNDAWLNPSFHPFDIRSECRAIGSPLLAIQGEDDEYATMAQLDALARAAPQTQLLKLPACGHLPQRDQPEQVNRAICAFLAAV